MQELLAKQALYVTMLETVPRDSRAWPIWSAKHRAISQQIDRLNRVQEEGCGCGC